jgi:tRNA threonylcarbamoyladenosine biosynthesis protein TsaE
MTRFLPDEAATLAFGAQLARALVPGLTIYLVGDLGAGKTTLTRGVLRGLGYTGKVKSPTYTLLELYTVSSLYLYHFDFYRFADPQEWLDAGFREYFNADSVCIVEWPEKAGEFLPAPDLRIQLEAQQSGRSLHVHAETEAGKQCLARLNSAASS